MRKPTLIQCFFLLLACLALPGCWESTDVTFHQPGNYYGAPDDSNIDADALTDRFANQRDR